MDLKQRLTDDMKQAMKAGQKERLSVIRMLLSDVNNIDLNPQNPTQQQTVEAYAKRLKKSRDEYEKLGRTAEVGQLVSELAVVESYLPKKATPQETEQWVADFFDVHPDFTQKQVGQATGAFMKAHGDKVDPAVASPLIRARLTKATTA